MNSSTIEEACGLPAHRSIDGLSLLGDVSGRQAIGMRGGPARFLAQLKQAEKLDFDPSRFAAGMTATFDGRYHRIVYSDGRVEVFDIENDPAETHPLK